jgi:hypothetical protein
MNQTPRIYLYLICIFSFFCTSLFAEGVFLSPDKPVQTFTFYDISKIETAKILGSKPSYDFYIPIPAQWEVDELDLSLVVQFSKILTNASTLTAMVDTVPIDTIKLDAKSQQPILWKIKIPKAYINKKLTTLRLVGDMRISNDVCADRENPGNWITLSGNSSVTYHYQRRITPLSISKFPYPFIQKNTPYLDTISLIFADNLNSENFGFYFMMANALSQNASWRGLEFDISTLSEFIKSSSQYPSIVIGTPALIDFSFIGSPDHMKLTEGHWVHENQTLLSDDEGFLWLTQYKGQVLLVISANTYNGLNSAINAINSKKLHYMSTNSPLYIAKSQTVFIKGIPKFQKVSFNELGFQDSVVFGTGESQRVFQFNLPHDYVNNPVKLILKYSNSPFIQRNRVSSMTVSINDVPIGGVVIKPDSAQKKTFEIELPIDDLKIGKNTLTVTFTLTMHEEICSRDYLSQVWGTIYADSYFEFYKSDEPAKNQLKDYPQFIDGNVVVNLPNDPAVYGDKQLLNALIQFSTTLNYAANLKVASNDFILKNKSSRDIVSFATHLDNPAVVSNIKKSFTKLTTNLNRTSSFVLKTIDNSIFANAFNKEQGVGFAGINLSEINGNTSHLMVYGYSAKDLGIVLTLLNTEYKRQTLSGDLVVSFQNGTYTNLSTEDINTHVQTEVAVERMSRIAVIVFICIFFALVLFVALFFYWRNRNS